MERDRLLRLEAAAAAAGLSVDSRASVVDLASISEVPTDLELRQLRSYGVYKAGVLYVPSFATTVIASPTLEALGGYGPYSFAKGHAHQHPARWCYRRWWWSCCSAYSRGPGAGPPPDLDARPHPPRGLGWLPPEPSEPIVDDDSLVALLDRIETGVVRDPAGRWRAWKATHPELFPERAA